MNPTDAQIVRVYTQVTPPPGVAGVAEASPNFIGPGAFAPTFDVVVEAEAGAILAFSGQPYNLVLYAYDVTQGVRVPPLDVPLPGGFIGPPSWPSFQQVTTIPLGAVPYIPGDVYKYTAALTSNVGPNAIASFMDSPLFILY